jgi:DNA gyrase subunit A
VSAKNIIKQNITETLETNYMPYAMSVIVSRAIPEIDGFKPSHRKLLYSMYKMKLLTAQKTKSANVVGQTMKLNPHGDQAIYATLVRLTRGHDALLHPFIDSKGNFGKHTSRDMAYAASRYTEVKLAPICEEIFKDIEKNVVNFVDNYDGQLKEPELLPTTYPNILVSANKGIAVGMASNIASFNLGEVCDATSAIIDDEGADITELIKAPDFTTGGYLIYNQREMKKIYENGNGSVKLRAKYNYDRANNCIEIYEIPYTTNVESIIEKIIALIKINKIKEISDLRDETDLKGLKIAIDLKRGVDYKKLMMKLYKMTPLEDTFSCNFNLLIDGRPKVLGVRDIIREWVKFRTECIKRQLSYDIEKMTDKLHLLKGLEKVLLDIDKTIKIIRETEEDSMVVPNLMSNFDIDDLQANFVADIKLRHLNREYILGKTKEIGDLEEKIEKLSKLRESDKKIKNEIKKDLKRIKKNYAVDRKTDLLYEEEVVEYKEEHFIENYEVRIFVTEHNYLKKISHKSLRGNDEHKLKEDDNIMCEFDAQNTDELLLFSNKNNLYKFKIHDLEDHKASVLGSYIPNLGELEEGEEIVHAVATNDYKGHMLFVFENGKVAKVPLTSYQTKNNRKKLIKAYADESVLKGIFFIDKPKYLLLKRHYPKNDENNLLAVSTEIISEKVTKSTKGIQVLRLKKNSYLSETKCIDEEQLEMYKDYISKKIPMAGRTLEPTAKQIQFI